MAKWNPLRELERRLRGDRGEWQGRGRRSTDREPNRGWVPAVILTLTIAGIDWFSKWLITLNLEQGQLVEVVEGRVAFWFIRNEAMILGLYGDLPLLSRQVIAALAAVLGVLLLFEVVTRGHRLPRRHRPWVWAFVGLASGGMLGNLGERAVHWSVTDFLSFRWGDIWLPPGNVADLALFACIPVAFVVIGFELAARSRRGTAEVRLDRRTPPLPEAPREGLSRRAG